MMHLKKNDHRWDDKGIENSTHGFDSKLDNNDNSNKNIKKGRWYSEYETLRIDN